jgi:hypothetical protein
MAPHSLVQEYLNRTEHVWGVVTNGLTLRLLRDSTLVRRQAYIEFDLQAILEEQRFHDFAALYRLIHRSRLPCGMADANECLLERYYAQTIEQGGRVREHLRDGVEECLKLLGNGFLSHPDNQALRDALRSVSASAGEKALLSLKIIDVACGSGHMLLAASRRVGKELAKLRTGEDEPAPERVRESIRDVISHCIYGVDRNPLAVDLCRVALWLESHTAGKPLTFLDHPIRCGDSLVGRV